ncbi:MAG: inositol monophosphatase family protein [Candidatus Omnitrophica bacterium]|nr:inositol monophosphatase family protein [Candidatus Omnitrophota bacterium]MDD5545761.1 inositol monophosphatase family protein [Candidatus Omnitrophota bacterium]
MNNSFSKDACRIVLKAGKYLKENSRKIKSIAFKGSINLVTNVDREVEGLLIRSLRKAFPEIGFLSEEIGEIRAGSDLKWVIDPIDGTTNFAHGFPFYSISVALEKDKKPILGIVYDPERRELFFAERGRGAFLNGKPIKVSAQKDLKKSLLMTGFSYNLGKTMETNLRHFRSFLIVSQAVRRAGSASLDLCNVACGRLDGYWELGLNPWDTAAAWLIVKEAGGEVTTFSGKPYGHYLKEILASNGKIHRQMSKILSKKRS